MIRFAVVALAISLPLIALITSAPGHPGGFYAEVIATGYAVKILSVDGNSHVSPDKLSAITKLVGNTRDLYTINYTLGTKGMNVITVKAPSGIEVAFRSGEIWKSEIILSDGSDPALSVSTYLDYDQNSHDIYDHSNSSKVKNFKIYANSVGDYGYTDPEWVPPKPPSSPPSPSDKAESRATFEKLLVDNETYVGWIVNITSYDMYFNSTNSDEINATAILNVTILANKNGKEVLLHARAYVRAYSPNSGVGEKEATVKIIVNKSGTYAWRNGVLKYTSSATTIKVKDITGIWDGVQGKVAEIDVDTNRRAEAIAELGNITLSVRKTDDAKIKHIKPGIWTFSSSGHVNLTMIVYPHSIASGYKQIFVQFTRQ